MLPGQVVSHIFDEVHNIRGTDKINPEINTDATYTSTSHTYLSRLKARDIQIVSSICRN